MRCLVLVAALLAPFLLSGCGKKDETLVRGGYDEKEMDAAIARARGEVEAFVVAFEMKDGDDFSVKAPITDKGRTEHFWLTDITYANGTFEGKIGNDPGIVGNVKFGQSWKIGKAEISDWMYFKGGKMHGNYTMRPLLKTMPQAEADKFRKMFAAP